MLWLWMRLLANGGVLPDETSALWCSTLRVSSAATLLLCGRPACLLRLLCALRRRGLHPDVIVVVFLEPRGEERRVRVEHDLVAIAAHTRRCRTHFVRLKTSWGHD